MKVILTGITGNLGHNLACQLEKEGIEIIPIVRHASDELIQKYKEIIASDLMDDSLISFTGHADCIIHCAGIVHFVRAGQSNEKMAQKIVTFSEQLDVPLCYVSTAYLYKPHGEPFNNQYEIDKNNAKKIVEKTTVPHAIISPSIIIGNSKNGEIMNFSGYYTVLGSILNAIRESDTLIRFPKSPGYVNVIPVDYVSNAIIDVVKRKLTGDFFATNPRYTSFETIISKSLEQLHLRDRMEFLDCTIEEFRKMELTPSEQKLLAFSEHFIPYWTQSFRFPDSIIEQEFNDEKDIGIMTAYFWKNFNEKRMEK